VLASSQIRARAAQNEDGTLGSPTSFRQERNSPMTDVQDKTESAREQADDGLDYEDVTFPARDGVPLEGWFIPAPGRAS
jgi:hypothetical protein